MTDNSEIKNCRRRHDVQEQSLAAEMIKRYNKKSNRLFIITIVLLLCWLSTIGLFIRCLNKHDIIIKTYTAETGGTHIDKLSKR